MHVSSKTSMSNALFHNLESGSNELQSGFSENQLKLIEKADTQPYLAKCRIQNLVVYNTLLPESFACLFDLERTFSNPLRAVFSKIEIFSGRAKFSSLYAGAPRVPPRVLTKPCGGKNSEMIDTTKKLIYMISSLVTNVNRNVT